MPPSRPNVTERSGRRVPRASRFWLATPPDTMSTIEVDTFAAGALFDLFGPFRVAGVEREIAAEFFEPSPALRVGRGADHQRRAHQFANLPCP